MAITLRDVTDADLPIFFDPQRDLTYNHMAAFTHKDPDDRAAFDAHWKKVLRQPGEQEPDDRLRGPGRRAHTRASPWAETARSPTDRPPVSGAAASRRRRSARSSRSTRSARLRARAAKDNVGSLRVLAKCGFEVIGEEIGFANARGKEIEEVVPPPLRDCRAQALGDASPAR